MTGNNNKSQTRSHHAARVLVDQEVNISSLKERLEALRPRNGNGSCSQVDESNSAAGVDLTSLLLLELLQKQGEQLRLPNEQL